MTQLFIRLYLSILVILFLAWLLYGYFIRERMLADRARIVAKAHQGGARLIANELDCCGSENRDQRLSELASSFKYPIQIKKLSELPNAWRSDLESNPKEVRAYPMAERDIVITGLSGDNEYIQLGPFPDYNLRAIEDAIEPWMQIAIQKVEKSDDALAMVQELNSIFGLRVEKLAESDIPKEVRERIAKDKRSAFYQEGENRWYAAGEFRAASSYLRVGPFATFHRVDQQAAATTLALVLLPAAVAIALLLRPFAWQLRRIETAAQRFASGELAARVDVDKAKSAKQLAEAFNHMASRTEVLVRTQRELLQAVSHELKTPLARMRFAIDLLSRSSDDSRRNSRLSDLDQATEELNALVEELLQYVKLETGAMEPKREWLDVSELVATVVNGLSTLYPNIQFDCVLPQEPLVCSIDRSGFHRVASNLVTNAANHARQKVSVRVSFVNNELHLSVHDDGSGIPVADRERVKEPFVRLGGVGSDRSGVGLGLSIVRRIVEQNSGCWVIEDSELGGCCVRVVLPVLAQDRTV